MYLFALLSLAFVTSQETLIRTGALLDTPLSGVEQTQATAQVVGVLGQNFDKALRVMVRRPSSETNATQLQLRNTMPVRKGDSLMATFWLRGRSSDGKSPARIEFLFERSADPWTKSVTHGVTSLRDPKAWRKVLVPFRAAETYAPGEAMVSLRLAFGPQTVEVGGLSLLNYGTSRNLEQLAAMALAQNPLGTVAVKVNLKNVKQRIRGLGGNFCQPRYGRTEALDVVGRYNLSHLKVVHARVGLPLNWWNPEPGVFRDEAQAQASLLALQEFARRKLPTVVSVWEGPEWMLGIGREQMGRTLPRERYDECIDAVARYLVLARDKYGCHVDYFSFNEPDYGVNFKFTSAQMAEFIRIAVPEFARRGLKTKFLVGDTANGTNFYNYARPLLEDKRLALYLGPLAFHSWDALSAYDLSYRRIAQLGRKYGKEVWCLEAGHDAQLWRAESPWGSWENGLRTAMAYARSINLTEASLMDYWTYQDNYPLVNPSGPKPYPVFHVMKQMEGVLRAGSRIATASSSSDEVQILVTTGPAKGQFAVMLVNPAGAGRAVLSGLPPRAKVRVVRSDLEAKGKAAGVYTVDRQGRLRVTVPVRSVVSVIGG